MGCSSEIEILRYTNEEEYALCNTITMRPVVVSTTLYVRILPSSLFEKITHVFRSECLDTGPRL